MTQHGVGTGSVGVPSPVFDVYFLHYPNGEIVRPWVGPGVNGTLDGAVYTVLGGHASGLFTLTPEYDPSLNQVKLVVQYRRLMCLYLI